MGNLVYVTFWLLLAFAWAVWWWTGPSSDELVVYPATCTNDISILPQTLTWRGKSFDFDKYQADRANCIILPYPPWVYKINKARGEVYYLGYGTNRLVDCSIFSRTDWTCSYPDGIGKVAIVDGIKAIHEDDLDNVNKGFFYLRRWQWWAVRLWSWWDGDPRGAWLIPEQNEYLVWSNH